MATEDQFNVALRGGGRYLSTKHVTLTMAAGATTSDLTFTPPTGSRVSAIKAYVASAFSGSPTNINLTVGQTAGGTQYVAATDIKAAGQFNLSFATGAVADLASWPNGQAVGVQIAAVGGTNPAGSVVVEVHYSAPNP